MSYASTYNMKNFSSPSEFRKYVLAVSAALDVHGYHDDSMMLEDAARMSCTTGGEWLSEIGSAVRKIKKISSLPTSLEEKLITTLKTTQALQPYERVKR